MTNTQKEVKANKKAAAAPERARRVETLKTIIIAVLITSVIAFVAGVHYQSNQDASKNAAVNAAVKTSQLKN